MNNDLIRSLTGNHSEMVRSLAANVITSRAALLNSSLLDSRVNLDYECGYPTQITPQQYRTLYDREGIATRVVSLYPEECWKEDPEIYESEEAGRTPWEQQLDDLIEETSLFYYMRLIDELSGIGSFGILLMGIDDGRPLNMPVDGIQLSGPNAGERITPATGKRKLLYMRAFDETMVTIADFDRDPRSRRCGQPTQYNVKFADPNQNTSHHTALASGTTEQSVHWTRVVHVADNCKANEVFGVSRMQPVYNRLYDLRKLLGGSAEMFWKGAFPGIALKADPDLPPEISNAEIKEELQKYQNNLQRIIGIVGVEVQQLAPQVADPESHIMMQLKAIAIHLRSPVRKLIGSEAAHLASTQDLKEWNDFLMSRMKKYLTPRVVKKIINAIIVLDCLPPAPNEGKYFVEWHDLNVKSAEEKAKVANMLVEMLVKYIQGDGDILVPPLEFLTIIWGLDSEQAKAILEKAVGRIGQEGGGDADLDPMIAFREEEKAAEEQAQKDKLAIAASKKPPGNGTNTRKVTDD